MNFSDFRDEAQHRGLKRTRADFEQMYAARRCTVELRLCFAKMALTINLTQEQAGRCSLLEPDKIKHLHMPGLAFGLMRD